MNDNKKYILVKVCNKSQSKYILVNVSINDIKIYVLVKVCNKSQSKYILVNVCMNDNKKIYVDEVL